MVLKVLLVFEDFNELTLTESFLKKVGFDVVGINNEVLLPDQLLSFNPDVVVANGKNNRVSSFSVGQRMKENHRYHGKVILVVPRDVRPTPQEMIKMRMDGILEAPVQVEKLIQVLCRLAQLDAQLFLMKLQKARISDPDEPKKMTLVTGGAGTEDDSAEVKSSEPRFNDPDRMQRYASFLNDEEIDIRQSTHDRAKIKEAQSELKKDWNFDKLEDQDELRRQFAEALFKKK